MILLKIYKLIAIFRFLIYKLLFKKSNAINFRYSNVLFQGYRRILLGKNNIFLKNSNILVDHFSNNQNIEIGDNNTFSSYSILRTHGGNVNIGDNCFFGEKVQVQGKGGVEIGSNVLIAANTFISSSNHDFQNPLANHYLRKEIPSKTVIEDFVWIGANAVIIAGVKIGHHSIIGAGTIVTKNVEPYTIVVGNPGKVIKKYNFENKQWDKVE